MSLLFFVFSAFIPRAAATDAIIDLTGIDGGACPTVALRDAVVNGTRERPARPTYAPAPPDGTTANFNIMGDRNYSPTDDEVEALGAILEEVWTEEIDVRGWQQPDGTDDALFDVYLSENLGRGYYGYTYVYRDGTPYVVINADMSWSGSTTEDAWKVTAAHEFHHAIQFSYDYYEEAWWMEATATWMEDEVYDDIDDYYYYLSRNTWPDYPELSLTSFNGWHEYGDVIWSKFIAENYGGHDAIKDIWDGCVRNDVLDATADYFDDQGTSFDDTFLEFAAVNALMDYEEGSNYDEVSLIDSVESYPADGTPSEFRPDYLGSNYIFFEPPGGAAQQLNLVFSGDANYDGDNVDWGVAILACNDTTCAWDRMDVRAGEGTYAVPGFGEDWTYVWMIPTVLSETGMNHDRYETPRGTEEPPEYTWSASLGEEEEVEEGDDDDSGVVEDSPPEEEEDSPADEDSASNDEDEVPDQKPQADKDEEVPAGCGCATGDTEGTAGWLALGLVGLLARRRSGRV